MIDDYKRFLTLRSRVMDAIREQLKISCSCKRYEGTFDLTFSLPDFFDYIENGASEPDYCTIYLHCYVIGPGRHYEWRGKSFADALDKCEEDINKWISEIEEDNDNE